MLLRCVALLVCLQLTSFSVAGDGWTYFQAVHSNWSALEQFDLTISEENFEPLPDVTIETRSNIRMICSYSERRFVGLMSRERVSTSTDTGQVISAKHLSATIVQDEVVHEILPLTNSLSRRDLKKGKFSEVDFPEIRLIGLDIKQPRMDSLDSVDQAANIQALMAKSSKESERQAGYVNVARQLPWCQLDEGAALYSFAFSYSFDKLSLMPSRMHVDDLWDRSGTISRTPSRTFVYDWWQHSSGLYVPKSISSTFSRWAIDKEKPGHVKPFNEKNSATFHWRSINQKIPEQLWDVNHWTDAKVILSETKMPAD